jgi:hypothetical protein
MAACLQSQHRPSAQVRVTWRFDAPDRTATLTPRRSPSWDASTQISAVSDDFDAALLPAASTAAFNGVRIPGEKPQSRMYRASVVASLACEMPGCGWDCWTATTPLATEQAEEHVMSDVNERY